MNYTYDNLQDFLEAMVEEIILEDSPFDFYKFKNC